MYLPEKIRFECQGCGGCCKSGCGWVHLTQEDVKNIAEFLGLMPFEFRTRFLKKKNGRDILSSPNFNPNCFLDAEGRCEIYPARPRQCRTYPFWDSVFKTKKSFQNECNLCPGLGKGPEILLRDKFPILKKKT